MESKTAPRLNDSQKRYHFKENDVTKHLTLLLNCLDIVENTGFDEPIEIENHRESLIKHAKEQHLIPKVIESKNLTELSLVELMHLLSIDPNTKIPIEKLINYLQDANGRQLEIEVPPNDCPEEYVDNVLIDLFKTQTETITPEYLYRLRYEKHALKTNRIDETEILDPDKEKEEILTGIFDESSTQQPEEILDVSNQQPDFNTPTAPNIHGILNSVLKAGDILPYDTSPREFLNKNPNIKDRIVKYIATKYKATNNTTIRRIFERMINSTEYKISMRDIDKYNHNANLKKTTTPPL